MIAQCFRKLICFLLLLSYCMSSNHTLECIAYSNSNSILERMNQIPRYYTSYCTDESVSQLDDVLAIISQTDLDSLTPDEYASLYDALNNALNSLSYRSGNVPQIFISTANENGLTLQKADGYTPASIVIQDKDHTIVEDSKATIAVRGNTTSKLNKKPFNLKFSKKEDLFGFGKAKKYCLLANAMDPTMLRQHIALDFAEELGLEFTSNKKFVEVYLDGSFRGCYLLTEAVQVNENRVEIESDPDSFFVEYEIRREEADVTYLKTENNLRYALKYPEAPSDDQLSFILSVLNGCEKALESMDWDQVINCMDVESFAQYYLLNEYMKNADSNFSSMFFYYFKGKLHAGPAWDYDLSSGNPSVGYYGEKYYSSDGKNYEMLYAKNALWLHNLFSYPEFDCIVKSLFKKHWEYMSSINQMIDSLVEEYRTVFDRNASEAGWSVSKHSSIYMRIPDATYDENVAYMKDFFINRLTYLEAFYMPPPPSGDCNHDGEFGIADAVLLQKWLLSEPNVKLHDWLSVDFNTDNQLTTSDLSLLKRALLKGETGPQLDNIS